MVSRDSISYLLHKFEMRRIRKRRKKKKKGVYNVHIVLRERREARRTLPFQLSV